MKRFPPYMIVAVCGILFLSAGMVIITADSTDPSSQPPPPTVDVPTLTLMPTEIVSVVVEQPAQPVVQPTDVPPVAPVEPAVQPTEVIQPIEPTVVVEQPVQSTIVEGQTSSVPEAGQVQVPQAAPVIAGGQVEVQPTAVLPIPATNMPVNSDVTPVVPQSNLALGTLPPPSNVLATAENPIVVPNVVVATIAVPTLQPTAPVAATLAVITQVSGQIGMPLQTDYSGIAVTLTLPDGTALQTTTDGIGHFVFANLAPGTYRVDANVSGYLSSQENFTLGQGQTLVLPSTMLIAGDTNLDNKIDLTDAALIAANFDSSSVVAGADINHDGVVDIRDLTAIGAYFGISGPTPWGMSLSLLS